MDKLRRKRLHALRLALKTLRYQTEWSSARTVATDDMLSQLKRVQTGEGHEDLADFRRWVHIPLNPATDSERIRPPVG
ncbi:MAG TPA: CHAD domain-containing protein, partial [Nitrospira sp.]|nr:CHAD domain-containing protein [Nitrospira sp.]